MLRRFGFGRASTVDACLSKQEIKLQELFETTDELLQEVHLQNPRLISFLRQPHVLSQLVNYVVGEPIIDEKTNYAYLSCEILSAGIPALMDGLVYAHPELLTILWAVLDLTCRLTARQLAGFAKVNAILLQRRTGDLVRFIEGNKDVVHKWLYHIFANDGAGVPYLSDLLIALIQSESVPEGAGIGQWLADHGLLTAVVDRYQPHLEPLNHEIAQQLLCDVVFSSHSSSPLITELTSAVTMKRLSGYMLDQTSAYAYSALISGTAIIRALRQYSEKIMSTTMEDPTMIFYHGLHAFTDRLQDLAHLLESPRSCKADKDKRLGLERLAVCELIMELLYCASIAAGEKGIALANVYRQKVTEYDILPRCLDLFFAFPSNNVLHNTIHAMIRDILGRETARPIVLSKDHLIVEVLVNGRLMERILDAYDAVREQKEQRGYMGHLALLSNDIQYALDEVYSPELGDYLKKLGSFSETLQRWSTHHDMLRQEIRRQLIHNNDPIFWSVSGYHELSYSDDTTRIYDTSELATRC